MTSIAPPASSSSLLTRGQYRSLELLEDTHAVRETLLRYERALGSPVYLRPTDKGLTVISLDPKPLAMVGVGLAKGSCNITALPPSEAQVGAAVAAYRAKLAAMRRRSPEERYVIGRIRTAIGAELRFDAGLIFLHQEWRFRTAGKLDLLALDQNTGQLVIIEVKQSQALALDPRTIRQGHAYVDLLTAAWAEHVAYFQRLADALARIYRLAEPPALDASRPPRVEVWWPGGSHRTSTIPTGPAAPRHAAPPSPHPAWRAELAERQSRWRERRDYPMGSHRGQPLRTRLAMPDAELRLWNFITPAIGDLAAREYRANPARPAPQRKLFGYPRLFDNLLSSQPLAFNLVGELALDLTAATAACRRLWPARVHTVTAIELEYSPGRHDPRYLNNATAADIAILHTTPDGGTGAIFIETKYYEDLSAQPYPLEPRYHDVAAASNAFRPEALPLLQHGSLQQLWLDHLLLLATRQTDRLDAALFVVTYPAANVACHTAVAEYRQTLTPEGANTFEAKTLENLVTVMADAIDAPWLTEFRDRYLAPT